MSYADKLVGLEGFNVQNCVHHLHHTFLEYIQDPECAVFHEYINYDEFGPGYCGASEAWERHEIHVFKGRNLLFTLYETI